MDLKDKFKQVENVWGGFLSWTKLRDLSVVLVCTALAYRLAVSKITIDLSGFGFTDLLSLILAISAIVLSAAFYFKADESSKNFYNNSYEFTKNISELLGRIEERFGAQLVSLNKSHDNLNNKFGTMPVDVDKVKEEQVKEREAIRKSEDEYQRMVESLMVKAQLDASQMEEMRSSMASLAAEAERAKAELAKHTKSLYDESFNPLGLSDDLFTYLRGLARDAYDSSFVNASLGKIATRFDHLVSRGDIDSRALKNMAAARLYVNDSLSGAGAKTLKHMIVAEHS